MKFQGQVILVTGASRGIGAAIARAFAAEGGFVVVNYLRNATSVSALTQKQGLGAIDVDMLQKGADAWKKIGLIQRDLKMKDVVSADLLPRK